MKNKFYQSFMFLSLLLFGACEKDYNYTLPPKAPPKVSLPSTTLEAYYSSTAPNTINSSYWKTANYLTVNAKDISTNLLYDEGGLNLTNTFSGLKDFNKGGNAQLVLKAGYDADFVYILAEWYDSTINLSQHTWMYNGAKDPLKPSEGSNAWTSQNNSDKFSMAFEIANAVGTSGNFATVGCAASCHGSGNNTYMVPNSGSVDIWNWSLATSSPLGYAHDMTATSTGFVNDAGGSFATRNSNGSTNRSGPAFEWDGIEQSYTLLSGTKTLLDPSYYLLNKTAMKGNAATGDAIYIQRCQVCHGVNGVGSVYKGATVAPINSIGQNKKARAAYITLMDSVPNKDMKLFWSTLTTQDKDDVVAYLRGISGSPGYVLTNPKMGTSSADITTVANITSTDISNAMSVSTNKHTKKYQILLKRKLKTNNDDDVQFDLTTNKTYVFGVALMDNDGKNHIGSVKETLSFK